MSRPWECPRCKKMNAPWLNQCFCGPTEVPATLPGNTMEDLKRVARPSMKAVMIPAIGRAPTLQLTRRAPTILPVDSKFDFDSDENYDDDNYETMQVLPARSWVGKLNE